MAGKLVDIGVNLGHAQFKRDLPDVIARAKAARVDMIITGTSVSASREALALAAAHDLHATVGVHPHDAKTCDDQTLSELREMLKDPRAVAIGECGLDYNRDFSPRPVQDKWFQAQVELAAELGKPLFLHEREAGRAFRTILRKSCRTPAVIHCFTGSEAELDAYLELGYYIGITGWICDERRGLDLQQMVKNVPLDRIMVETDAPFLLPRHLTPKPRDGRNEPSFLPHIVETLARCMDRFVSEVTDATTANARKFFGLQ